MRTCKECGVDISHKFNAAIFCGRKCANAYKGRQVAAAHEGAHATCVVCNVKKPPAAFSFAVKGNYSAGKKPYCKPCGRIQMETARRDRTWKHDAAQVLLNNSRQRAKRAGLVHTLTHEDIAIPDKCPVLGVELRREGRSTWARAPSIDRVDNRRGYTLDNIVIVSRRANILKKDATVAELVALATFYGKFLGGAQ